MFSYSLFLVTTICLTSAHNSKIMDYGPCKTPDAKLGVCRDILQCTSLRNMLTTRPIPEDYRQFLRYSECGRTNETVLACCSEIPSSADNLVNEEHCGTIIPSLSTRILHGNRTALRGHPWMAQIGFKYFNKIYYQCGATLINSRYVLTAAHCIKYVSNLWIPISVRLGDWDTTTDIDCETDAEGNRSCSNPHVDIAIEKIIVHSGYRKDSEDQLFDIALVRLARKVSCSDFIRPICLPLEDSLRYATHDGTFMNIVGFGQTESTLKSNKKLMADIPVVRLEVCQRYYRLINKTITSSQLCAGGIDNIDSCAGDSGGPLTGVYPSEKSRHFIAGIVSYGPVPCGFPGWPSVYTRVGEFIDWIRENLQS